MKLFAAILFLLLTFTDQAPRPPTQTSFRYRRTLAFPATANNSHAWFACAPLDADVFAHTGASMSDMRVFGTWDGTLAIPYVITLSNTSGSPEAAHILNLGTKADDRLALDLRMPSRPYSALDLQLNAQDFIASATVQGLRTLHDPKPTYLGAFTLFDLSSQHLGKSSHFEFAESTFPYLHLELTFSPAAGAHSIHIAPQMVTGAEIPVTRLAQVPYTPVLATSVIDQQPRKSVVTFKVPAHVPVERVTFVLDENDQTSFSRPVTISAAPDKPATDPSTSTEQVSGEISRVHVTEAGHEVRQDSLSVAAVLGSNAQSSATIHVTVENGDNRALPFKAVRLEMRERTLCFSVSADPSPYPMQTLFYGGDSVPAPVYDLGRFFDPAKPALPIALGPEEPNPRFTPAALPAKPFTERHPAVLWAALSVVLVVLGLVAFRSAKKL